MTNEEAKTNQTRERKINIELTVDADDLYADCILRAFREFGDKLSEENQKKILMIINDQVKQLFCEKIMNGELVAKK